MLTEHVYRIHPKIYNTSLLPDVKIEKWIKRRIYIFMKRFYKKEVEKFTSLYKKQFIIVASLFLIMTFVGYYIAGSFPEFGERFSKNWGKAMDVKGITQDVSSVTATFGILKNNVVSCSIYILVGLIPFFFIPYAYSVFNGTIIGVLIYSGFIKGVSIFKLIFLGLLPHGITELSALFLSLSIGLYICTNVSKKIFFRNAKIKLIEVFKYSFTTFALIVIPLVIISAIIEGFITKALVSNFLY
ncbi:stage II sporulation protein M [Bacillus sp. S13(2024)]|uniref:stage II sporulation protein M n=1 Tax=unclassified Bacillus (in: firmicutes) TaxID=185979 RepID=UPI003D2433CB